MNSEPQPFIPYGRQTISEDDIAAVVEVLRSPFLTQGPAVPVFENAVAAKVGARFGVAVNSATSALHIACLALGLGPRDRLWTSPITFVASANCGRYCGAEIDFVDIEPSTGLMSVVALEAKLQQADRDGKLPKVVVPVHLTGSSCDMAKIALLADRYGFAVLEDASHAIGGRYLNQPVGNCRYSDITVFSFHPVKIVTTGEGGLATTNDDSLFQSMYKLRSHGIVKDSELFELSNNNPWIYEQQQLGFNYRMTDIQAALGLSQLQRLDEIVQERNNQLQIYRDALVDIPAQILDVPKGVISSVHLAVIRLKSVSAEKHCSIFQSLRSAGIGVQVHYIPVHLHPYYRTFNFNDGDFPHAEAYAKSVISLPLFPGLTRQNQEYVIDALRASLKS